MNRRETFLASLAMLAAGAPALAASQDARRLYRVGILGFGGSGNGPGGPRPADKSTSAFLDGMHALGYRCGEHFVTELRGPGGNPERLPVLAVELVRQQPDVIIAGGGLPAVALKQATTTIPIVMASSVDPVVQVTAFVVKPCCHRAKHAQPRHTARRCQRQDVAAFRCQNLGGRIAGICRVSDSAEMRRIRLNLARTLGLEIPNLPCVGADEVIQ